MCFFLPHPIPTQPPHLSNLAIPHTTTQHSAALDGDGDGRRGGHHPHPPAFPMHPWPLHRQTTPHAAPLRTHHFPQPSHPHPISWPAPPLRVREVRPRPQVLPGRRAACGGNDAAGPPADVPHDPEQHLVHLRWKLCDLFNPIKLDEGSIFAQTQNPPECLAYYFPPKFRPSLQNGSITSRYSSKLGFGFRIRTELVHISGLTWPKKT